MVHRAIILMQTPFAIEHVPHAVPEQPQYLRVYHAVLLARHNAENVNPHVVCQFVLIDLADDNLQLPQRSSQ